MSLASDYSPDQDYPQPSARNYERPPRWTRMRSREGSEAGTPCESVDSRTRPRFDPPQRPGRASPQWSSQASSVQGDYLGPRRQQPGQEFTGPASVASSYGSRPRSHASSAARQEAQETEKCEIKRIIESVGHSIIDRYGNLSEAFREIKSDAKGDLRRGDVRRFFEMHHVATRMADRFFDHYTKDRRSSTIAVDEVKSVFDNVVGAHMAKKSAKNVHGLLRPMKTEKTLLEMQKEANDRQLGDGFSEDQLKQILKHMTSREQRRYVENRGTIQREDLQTMFWSYGFKAEQANHLFDEIDKGRTGDITFKDFSSALPGFLGIKNETTGRKYLNRDFKPPLDEEAVRQICDGLGTKAAQKYKTVHDAFRFVDKDGNDKVDRWEVRQFFRNYGSKTKTADLFFDTLDRNREGKIDFNEFQDRFAPYIQPGYHPPRPGENQKEMYKQTVKWGTSQYDKAATSTSNKSGRPRSNRSSRSNSVASMHSSQCQDELHLNRFGRFEGISTYQASFNQNLH